MKKIAILVIGAACLLIAGGDVTEPQPQTRVPYAGGETYFYYPAYELYYYPSAGQWCSYDNGWQRNRRIPDRFKNVVSDSDRVAIQWPREPHLDHAQIRRQYPPPATAYRAPGY